MFTGIVEELGTVVEVAPLADGSRLTISGALVTSDARHGDSIAVNGVCLTVVDVADGRFTVDVVSETLRRSSLRGGIVGDRVNLERALAVGSRLGGHVVQGHVDGTATLRETGSDGITRFELPADLSRYVVEKGSITVDGVSLTVATLDESGFGIALIPTTCELTTLGRREPGDQVNIEVDVLAKYVERLSAAQLARVLPNAVSQGEDNVEKGTTSR